MLGVVATQTGTPRRPKLRAIVRPLKFPPKTSAPVVSVMGMRPLDELSPARCQVFLPFGGTELSKLSDEPFPDLNPLARGFPCNVAEQRA